MVKTEEGMPEAIIKIRWSGQRMCVWERGKAPYGAICGANTRLPPVREDPQRPGYSKLHSRKYALTRGDDNNRVMLVWRLGQGDKNG